MTGANPFFYSLEEGNHQEQSYSAELVGGFELLPSVEKTTSKFFQLLAGIPQLRENNLFLCWPIRVRVRARAHN